jgi:DNA integrity scanning protein DisA with diadenylate cyclase activity
MGFYHVDQAHEFQEHRAVRMRAKIIAQLFAWGSFVLIFFISGPGDFVLRLVVFLLSKFLYKPLLAYLDKRRDLIKQNIEEAENLKKEFQRELKEQEVENKKIIDQMQKEVAQAKKEAEQKADEPLTVRRWRFLV